MERQDIIEAAKKVHDRYSLLVLLNRLKEDDLGDKAHPFTMAQLNYFCHPSRNAKHYVNFTIPKRSGGVREISAPQKMLKSFLTYVNVILQALYEPSPAAMGFVPGRSVVENAKEHVRMNYVLNLDLSNFFPSIPQARVWGALQSNAIGFNRDVANALAAICCTEMTFYEGKPVLMAENLPEGEKTEKRCVLPQGSPASPILTNIVCINLDRRLSGLARRFNVNYTRYADDITFSSMHNVYQKDGEFMTELRRIIADQHFSVNEAKTRLQKRGSRQEVTGLVVSDRVNVVRGYARSIGSLLYIWKRYGHDSAYARFLQHYAPKRAGHKVPPMERVIEGKLLYLRMVKGEKDPVYQRLSSLFDKLVDKAPKKVADIDYIASYTMEAFEKQFSTVVRFFEKKKRKNDKEDAPARYGAEAVLCGEKANIVVSQSCQERIREAVRGGGEEALGALKQKMYVSRCSNGYSEFWMVMKSRPENRYASTAKRRTIGDIARYTDSEMADLLKDFVDSGFDLNSFEIEKQGGEECSMILSI